MRVEKMLMEKQKLNSKVAITNAATKVGYVMFASSWQNPSAWKEKG